MLRSSSNRAVNSTSTVNLLVARGGALQGWRLNDDPNARPVGRLLDGEHVGIVGGLRHERDDRVVRLVRMVRSNGCSSKEREQIRLLRIGQQVDRLVWGSRGAVRRADRSTPSETGDSSGPGTT